MLTSLLQSLNAWVSIAFTGFPLYSDGITIDTAFLAELLPLTE